MNIQLKSRCSKSENLIRAELELKRSGKTSFISHQLMPHPFHITVPFQFEEDPKDLVTIYMQSSSGGLYEKDLHDFTVRLQKGSKLHLTTQASTIVHCAKENLGSEAHVNLNLEDGTVLEYLPDPVILMAGSEFYSRSNINLKGDCRAIVTESFLAHDPSETGQMFKSCNAETLIFCADELILDDKFFITGHDYFSRIRGYTCMASIYLYGYGSSIVEKLKPALGQISGSVTGFSHFKNRNLFVLKILAQGPISLLRTIESTWAMAREDMTGCVPRKRRK